MVRVAKAPVYSAKGRSVRQETFIAQVYDGQVSRSSGAAANDSGDVRTKRQLIECKQTGAMDKAAKSYRLTVDDLEKACDEAWADGLDPAIAIRIYNPGSVLSDTHGNIDLIVRLVADDQAREERYGKQQVP